MGSKLWIWVGSKISGLGDPAQCSPLTVGILKWKEVNLSMECDDSAILGGVRRMRSDWNSLFEARLQPKKFKPKESNELLLKTLEEILIKEGKNRSPSCIYSSTCQLNSSNQVVINQALDFQQITFAWT